MSGRQVIYALLSRDSSIGAMVSDRIYDVEIKQGSALPAVAYSLISGVPRNTVSTAEATKHRRERIQVTVATKNYPDQVQLLDYVRKACRNFRGDIGGVIEASTLEDVEGPDLRDSDSGLYMQTIDFMVTYTAT